MARELGRSGGDDDDGRVAVLSAFPKAISSLVAALQSSDALRLHPVGVYALPGAVWLLPGDGDDEGGCCDGGNAGNVGDGDGGSRGDAFLWSIMDRRDWDPRGASSCGSTNDQAPQSIRAPPKPRLAPRGSASVALTPDVLVPQDGSFNEAPGCRVLIVTDSNAAVEDALVRWGAARRARAPWTWRDRGRGRRRRVDRRDRPRQREVERRRRRRRRRARRVPRGRPAPRGALARCACFESREDLEDVAEALRAGSGPTRPASVLAPGAWVIGQIRLRRSRHRRANERAAGAFRAKGFTRVRVLHLLSDREHERTLACRVGFG